MKSKKGKMILTCVVIVSVIALLILRFELTRCIEKDCNYERYGKSKYCEAHLCVKLEYAERQGTLSSNLSKEEQEIVEMYRIGQLCEAEHCDKKRSGGSRYCALHKCRVEGCTKIRYQDYGYCEVHAYIDADYVDEASGKKPAGQSGHHYSGNSSEWPDCDDYDSFEDFMDDWDGEMPNGMDAEDYWEDW